MSDLCSPKALLRRDGLAFLMARGKWRGTWTPIDQLPKWRKFYADLAARKAGAYGHVYGPWVAVLDELAAKIRSQ